MARFALIAPDTSDSRTRELFDAAEARLGALPNMLRGMARAPAVLEAFLHMSSALSKGALPAKTREQIALSVSQANDCAYCLAAHSTFGAELGLSPEQILAARRGAAVDASTNALLELATALVVKRGRVSSDDLDAVRAAGFGDDAIAEVVGNVALSVFTNSFNHVADPALDFPAAPAL